MWLKYLKTFFKVCLDIFCVIFLFAIIIEHEDEVSYPPPQFINGKPVFAINDTTVKAAPGIHYKRSPVYNFFFGKHYRDIWTLPIPVKVFDIGKIHGGLEIIELGGNEQTVSLRLSDSTGRRYVLRTVDKDQAKALSSKLRKTLLKHLFRDQASALNPFGALIVAPLAEAAGLLHCSPELYFVPADSRFGKYAQTFSGRMALFEEHPNKSWIKTAGFDFPVNIIKTDELIGLLRDQNVSIDVMEFAKCRLFDILIGDWDRHKGQWAWAEYHRNGKRVFRPIPKDRDMAFYKYNDGVITWISTFVSPKLQTFENDFSGIKGLTENGHDIDVLLLKNITEKQLIAISESLKASITDEVIHAAVKEIPPAAYKKIGEELISKLKSRRDKLDVAAKKFYDRIQEE